MEYFTKRRLFVCITITIVFVFVSNFGTVLYLTTLNIRNKSTNQLSISINPKANSNQYLKYDFSKIDGNYSFILLDNLY